MTINITTEADRNIRQSQQILLAVNEYVRQPLTAATLKMTEDALTILGANALDNQKEEFGKYLYSLYETAERMRTEFLRRGNIERARKGLSRI